MLTSFILFFCIAGYKQYSQEQQKLSQQQSTVIIIRIQKKHQTIQMKQKNLNMSSMTSLYSANNNKSTWQSSNAKEPNVQNNSILNYTTSTTKSKNKTVLPKSKKAQNQQINDRSKSKSFRKTGNNCFEGNDHYAHQNKDYRKNSSKSKLRDLTFVYDSNPNSRRNNGELENYGVSMEGREEGMSSQFNKENRTYRVGVSGKQYEQRPHQSQNFGKNLLPKSLAETHRKLYTFCNEPKLVEVAHPPDASRSKSRKSRIRDLSEAGVDSPSKDLTQSVYPMTRACENIRLLQRNTMNFNKQLSRLEIYDQWESYGHQISNDGSSTIPATIMVKEDQLKRFTHKFAREKIQFEEIINGLKKELRESQELRQFMDLEKKDLIQCLHYKQQSLKKFQQQLQEITEKLLEQRSQHQKFREQSFAQLQFKQSQIRSLSKLLEMKSSSFALSNLPHAQSYSAQSSLSNQQSCYEQQSFTSPFLRMPVCGEQCKKMKNLLLSHENKQVQLNNLATFYKIENQYVKRQLQLEKQANFALKDQINKIKQQLQHLHYENVQISQQSKDTEIHKKMEDLLEYNASLLHDKQTLQRSLQVSSQMIINLKQESTVYKHQLHNHLQQTPQQIPISHLETVIFQMMQEQLQLEQKLQIRQSQLNLLKCEQIQREQKKQVITSRENYNSKKFQEGPLIPVCLERRDNKKQINLQENLQRLYEEGYQSVKRKHQNKENKGKNSGNDSCYRKFYTEASISDQFSSQDQSHIRKQRNKTHYSPKCSILCE